MSFLLDTDICSAYLKANHAVQMRFFQYGGRLYVSTITLGELWAWAGRAHAPARRQYELTAMLQGLQLLSVDEPVARKFGAVRAWQLDKGLRSPGLDFLNGVTALTHDLTLVTHNTSDYANIPHLRLADWPIG